VSWFLELSDELGSPAQALQIEQGRGRGSWWPGSGRPRVVGGAHRDGGVGVIGQADDEVGVAAAADADQSEPLTAERVMRMGDGHESQRRLG
jgi:hypothetical protein